ncbi:MAG: hypothetical protein MJ107_07820 [Lachnospiraceae bacterium]|nr:hypothetical protein [Lachnospiraceae bacterium]
MSYNNEIAAVEKSCGITLKVVKIIAVFVKIGLVMAIVAAFLCALAATPVGEKIKLISDASYEDMTVDIHVFGIDVIGTTLTPDQVAGKEWAIGIAVSILCIIAAVLILLLLKQITNIFENILSEKTPFSDSVIKPLRISFIIITIIVLMGNGLGSAAIIGLFFWCIYTIFKYGATLQKQADETL